MLQLKKSLTALLFLLLTLLCSAQQKVAQQASLAAEHITLVAGRGEIDLPILGITIPSADVEKETNSLSVSSISFSLEGTTDLKDIRKLKLYSANSLHRFKFSEPKLLAEGKVAKGTIIFKFATPLVLNSGANYFYLAADVAGRAKEGNQIDAKFISVNTSNGKVVKLKESGNPAHSINIFLTKNVLFAPGEYGSKFYRIPAITTAADGSLVTVTDRRLFSNVDLPMHIDLYARRSTDKGRTWSEPLMIAGAGDDRGYGDAAIVRCKSGRIIAAYVGVKGLWDSKWGDPQQQLYVYSDDNGVTWSKPRNITAFFYGPNSPNPLTKEWDAFFITAGRGLCTEDGRILFAIPTRVRGKQGLYVHTICSDDEGETWRILDADHPATVNGDESKLAQLNNGDLLMTIRKRGGKRDLLRGTFVDGEVKWGTPTRNEYLTDPFCNGEILVYTSVNKGYDKNRLLHSQCDAKDRSNVTVFLSYDEGATFPIKRTITPAASAYSTMTILDDGTIGCYYEEGGEYMDMVYVRFSLEWLTKGADKYVPLKK